ncbi:hypothetical protein WME89_43210 [Sorangium sp. So ce321]|uniref:hypothetical protein n=1 Tax=Sorangium sp. So ce321 TaxID=3133300 RepID=UPI003F5F936B
MLHHAFLGDLDLDVTHIITLVPSAEAHGARALWIGTRAGGPGRLRHDGWFGFIERNAGVPGSVHGVAEAMLAQEPRSQGIVQV